MAVTHRHVYHRLPLSHRQPDSQSGSYLSYVVLLPLFHHIQLVGLVVYAGAVAYPLPILRTLGIAQKDAPTGELKKEAPQIIVNTDAAYFRQAKKQEEAQTGKDQPEEKQTNFFKKLIRG